MLENHVPSLELCKKWKEIGGRQDTEFYWVMCKTPMIRHKDNMLQECCRVCTEVDPAGCSYEVWNGKEHEHFAAPLASELMEWLPDTATYNKMVCDLTIRKYSDCYTATYHWFDIAEKEFFNKSLPNALMQMAISRKEEEDGRG